MFRRKPKSDVAPECLIVGLGNPGAEYRGTRHNIGFAVIEAIAERSGCKMKDFKFQARTGTAVLGERPVALAMPMTFMNLSGRSVGQLMRHLGIGPGQLLVVADDLDLPFGTLRIKPFGGAGGHNGHRSIIQSIGSDKYPRLKFGIGKAKDGDSGADHVLSTFDREELADLPGLVDKCTRACEAWVSAGLDRAMNDLNSG